MIGIYSSWIADSSPILPSAMELLLDSVIIQSCHSCIITPNTRRMRNELLRRVVFFPGGHGVTGDFNLYVLWILWIMEFGV